MSSAATITRATNRVCKALKGLKFSDPVTHTYNPLEYARKSHQAYIDRFADSKKRVLFMGMNPGSVGHGPDRDSHSAKSKPFATGWASTKKWPNRKTNTQNDRLPGSTAKNPKSVADDSVGTVFRKVSRPDGFLLKSLRQLTTARWYGWKTSGRNRTPDKISASEMEPVHAACDKYVLAHLQRT